MGRKHSKLGSSRYNLGGKQYRHFIYCNDGQLIKAGGIVLSGNSNKFKIGKNTYFGKHNRIHAKINGIVEIKNKVVSVYEKEM